MNNNKYFILVNKDNLIKSDLEFDMVEYVNSLSEVIIVEKKTLESFLKLKSDMLKLGIDVDLDSAYRSIDAQRDLEMRLLKDKGIDYVKKYVAKPGYSEHHTGLAIDIIIIKDNKVLPDEETFYSDEIKEIQDNLYKYGFILRYPDGKESITGYNYEPWHFRFIDNEEIAEYIYDKSICLEEFLNK